MEGNEASFVNAGLTTSISRNGFETTNDLYARHLRAWLLAGDALKRPKACYYRRGAHGSKTRQFPRFFSRPQRAVCFGALNEACLAKARANNGNQGGTL
jgi:hypothetical protein